MAKKKKQEEQPGVYYLSLSLENVKCFKEKQTLDLSDGKGNPARWTVILGENGTGKTTLLRSLAAMKPIKDWTIKNESPYDKRYDVISPISASYNGLLYYDSGSSLLNLDMAMGQLQRSITNTQSYSVALELENGVSSVTYIEDLKYLNLLLLGYGTARRGGLKSLSQDSDSGSSNPKENYFESFKTLINDDEELINAEEWLLQAEWTSLKSADKLKPWAENRFKKIKELLIQLLPDVEDIRSPEPTKKNPHPSVEVKTPYGWVKIKDISHGYQTLIAWTVDLASRMFDHYADEDNPLAQPAVVLVDEIDLHLHPRWQRTVMQDLTRLFPRTQFIVTAHSPLIVQSAEDANVVVLKREGDHVVIENDPREVKNWRVDQILASELFGNISTRPPEVEKMLERRYKLLMKKRLTTEEKEELQNISDKLETIPTADTPEEIEAMEIIREASKHLQKTHD